MADSKKVSIRFFDDKEVRAIWDDENSKWWFSVLDIVGVLNNQDDYTKNRNYWKYFKAKLKKEANQLVSATTQLKFSATDGKKYKTDSLDADGVTELAKLFPNNKASKFLEWFIYDDNSIDGQSKKNIYKCVDWSKINKKEYLSAMEKSVIDDTEITKLLFNALTDKINDREMFMKGIDYSYYYEEAE